MAGVIVPLVLGALPELEKLISLIVGLVHKHAPVIEAQGGSWTGPVKFADLFVVVQEALIKAHAAGAITGDLPSPELVKVLIETIVQSLKALGMLQSTPTAPLSAPTQTITIGPGQNVVIAAL